MAIGIKVTSAAEARREQQIRETARKVADLAIKQASKRTDDNTDYLAAQANFKKIALDIRNYLNTNYAAIVQQYPDLGAFKGSFEETSAIRTLIREGHINDQTLITKLVDLLSEDHTLEYEAKALGIEDPQPWFEIWLEEYGFGSYEEYLVWKNSQTTQSAS